MSYNDILDSSDIGAVLSRPEYINQIFDSAIQQSAFMQLAKRLPNMGTTTTKMAVVDALPIVYWQATPTSLKQTTEQKWADKTITAEELAAIVVIPESTLADTSVALFETIKPRLGEAIGAAIDQACLFGTGKPTSFPAALIPGAIAAGKTYSMASPTDGHVDLYDYVLSEGGIFSMVEGCGYDVNGSVSSVGLKARMRGNRTSEGLPIFARSLEGGYTFSGEPIFFLKNGAWADVTAVMLSGDFNECVWALRQDLTFKYCDEGIIQNADKSIAHNLLQEDKVALRCVFRMGWQMANPVNRLDTSATRYPVAVLTP